MLIIQFGLEVRDRPTDRPTDRQTDRRTDIATYRAAIAAKNMVTSTTYNDVVTVMALKLETLETEKLSLTKKMEEYETKYVILKQKLKTLEEKVLEAVAVIDCTESDEDNHEEDVGDSSHDELLKLIEDSQKKRDEWEKCKSLTPVTALVVNPHLEDGIS